MGELCHFEEDLPKKTFAVQFRAREEQRAAKSPSISARTA
jgi:hypothetical protein